MALAQPTGLQVQTLEPLITVEQAVERDVAAGTLIGVTQVVAEFAIIRPAQTLVTLDQTVRTDSARARQTLITLNQTTERHAPASRLVRVRQVVKSDAATPAAKLTTLITLDDVDITAQCSPAFDVTASESDNRTATVVLYPGSGPINITSYQGRDIEIHRLIDGAWTPLFVGKVDVPTYNRGKRTLQLRCSDLRNERLGKEDQERLKTLTGGLYSSVTQREEATGEQWVRELMKTVEGSLDYTGSGALRYTPWAVTTPKFTLTAGDIHHREVSLEFATRSEIVNRVPISVAYRWYKRNAIGANVSAGIEYSSYGSGSARLPASDQVLPTKEALRSAAYNLSGWRVISVGVGSLPSSGWYRDTSSAFINRVAYYVTPSAQETYGTSVTASLIQYISQGMRWTDQITVEAPQSIDQFGEIEGAALSLTIDTKNDPQVFEENGCSSGDEKDRLDDRSLAIRAAQRMASKVIRGSHRNNYAQVRYKPPGGDLLPVEIGDTISVTSDEVTVTGWASEIRHATTVSGDHYTDVKLAVSRVDSAVTATDTLAVPAVGTPRRINQDASQSGERVCGPSVEPDSDSPKVSQIALDGSITLVAPSISADKTDELVGETSHTYTIAIPVNPFTVEVP